MATGMTATMPWFPEPALLMTATSPPLIRRSDAAPATSLIFSDSEPCPLCFARALPMPMPACSVPA